MASSSPEALGLSAVMRSQMTFDEGIGGQVDEAVVLVRIFGIAADLADQLMVFDEAGGDVVGHDHADASAIYHFLVTYTVTRCSVVRPWRRGPDG